MIHRVPWEAASTRPELPGARVLARLADRVEALEGKLRVSSPRGAGTTVTAELPCE
jgi:hypothetical protein